MTKSSSPSGYPAPMPEAKPVSVAVPPVCTDTGNLIGREVPEWIGADADTPVPPRVRARVFLRFDGICQECGVKIRAKRWICDHRMALINGGSNRECNLGPIHEACDKTKTASDVAIKSKVARVRNAHLGIRKPRTITRWRRMNGDIVIAPRER